MLTLTLLTTDRHERVLILRFRLGHDVSLIHGHCKVIHDMMCCNLQPMTHTSWVVSQIIYEYSMTSGWCWFYSWRAFRKEGLV